MRLLPLLVLAISAAHASIQIPLPVVYATRPQPASTLKGINSAPTLDDWCIRYSSSPICRKLGPICEGITKEWENGHDRTFKNIPIRLCCKGYFPAIKKGSDSKLLSRFDIDCRRSYYKRTATCRRRLREMVDLMKMDEFTKKEKERESTIKQLKLEAEHAGHTGSTIENFYHHHY